MEQPLDETGRARLHAWNVRLADPGLRLLALARSHVRRPAEDAATDLTFVALVGIAAPPAANVRETISLLQDAGVRTVMITGDQRLIAAAALRELGLARRDGCVIDGRELNTISDADLPARLRDTAAVCRMSPSGVAVGVRGTDVAKDASDMVLADDRFATIGPWRCQDCAGCSTP